MINEPAQYQQALTAIKIGAKMTINKLIYTGKKPEPGSWEEKLLLFFQNNPEEYIDASDAGIKFGVMAYKAEQFMDEAHEVELLIRNGDNYLAGYELLKHLKKPKPTKSASYVDRVVLEDDIPLPAVRGNRPVSPWLTLLKKMKVKQSFEVSIAEGRLAEKQAIKLKALGLGRYTTEADLEAGTIRFWRVA